MPKVSDKYTTDKRNFILECTGEILKEKPLYLVTMRDIIKKAGFSHGIIYHYYANLDEIYVGFINKHTTQFHLDQRIDALLCSEKAEKDILSECFMAMGEYIEELLKSVVGKTFFELTVLCSYDFEKRASIFPKLRFKQDLEYAQQKIVDYILSNVDKGVFSPQIPVRSIILFVSSFIDGLAQSMAINTIESNNDNSEQTSDIHEMFRALANAVIGFLGGEELCC